MSPERYNSVRVVDLLPCLWTSSLPDVLEFCEPPSGLAAMFECVAAGAFEFTDAKRVANDYEHQFESSADFNRPAGV